MKNDLPPPGCPRDCFKHGLCVNSQCSCHPGYAGDDCAQVKASDCGSDLSCSGNGKCQHGRCWCDMGWSGASCATKSDCPGGCSGHGQCKWGTCYCDKYWKGSDCSEADGEKPAANAGVSWLDSSLIAVAAFIGGIGMGIVYKVVQGRHKRSRLKTVLESGADDAAYTGFHHIGDK